MSASFRTFVWRRALCSFVALGFVANLAGGVGLVGIERRRERSILGRFLYLATSEVFARRMLRSLVLADKAGVARARSILHVVFRRPSVLLGRLRVVILER